MFYKINRVKCLICDEIITSTSSREWETCSCGSVKIRGGRSMLERDGNPKQYKELSVIDIPPEIATMINDEVTDKPAPPLPPGMY